MQSAAEAMEDVKKKHPDCSGSSTCVLSLPDGSTLVTTTIPARFATGAALLAWPISAAASAALVATQTKATCQAHALKAFTEPFFKYELSEAPRQPGEVRLRSLGADLPLAPIELPPATCFANADASHTFLLEMGDHVFSEEQLEKKNLDRRGYLEQLGRAALHSFEQGLLTNGLYLGNLFDLNEHGNVSGEALCEFYDLFLPLLAPNQNILIGIPAHGSTAALYSFTFKFPHMPAKLPLIGLIHQADPTASGAAQTVEGDQYIYSNVELALKIKDPRVATQKIELRGGLNFITGPYGSYELSSLARTSLLENMGTMGNYDHKLGDSAIFVANLFGRQLPNSALEASVTVLDTVEALHKRKRDKEVSATVVLPLV